MINENLKHGDLKGVVVERISVDEFEPKTGEKEDIAVIGFYVTEQAAGDDLARFIAKSVHIRDVLLVLETNTNINDKQRTCFCVFCWLQHNTVCMYYYVYLSDLQCMQKHSLCYLQLCDNACKYPFSTFCVHQKFD